MTWLFEEIGDWFKQVLVDAIMASFSSMFGTINEQVSDIAVQVGQTPAEWNAGVFAMIRALSETVVLPIAGMILTFVLCYELIQLVIEKNNLSDFDTFNIFKWIFKTFVAVFILTNTFNIVLGVFELAQSTVNASAGLISGSVEIGSHTALSSIQAQFEAMEIGELLALLLETQIIKISMGAMGIVIFIVVVGRMIEIYLVVSIAPIPLSTMANREWGQIGNNYLKSLFAIGFQGFLIMVCVAIYSVLISGIAAADSIHSAIWSVAGLTALLCYMLLKSGGLAKSLFSAH